MRELLLLRHAKSSWGDPSLDDFDRPLALRGMKAAPVVGREMRARGWIPDRAVVSPAVRALLTWHLVAAELGPGVLHPLHDEVLYMASATELLAVIRITPPSVRRLMLVGHNPALEELAQGLAGRDSDAAARTRMQEKFPTAALARFEFGESWLDLAFGGALLTDFLRPKDLAPRDFSQPS